MEDRLDQDPRLVLLHMDYTGESVLPMYWSTEAAGFHEDYSNFFSHREESEITAISTSHEERRRKWGSRYSGLTARSAHQVARRNARERRRVEAVNVAFAKLQRALPPESENSSSDDSGGSRTSSTRRVSKVRTLQRAIAYIQLLNKAIETLPTVSD